ncbi:MAG: hypothetical protein FJ088_09835, partial [Deltaproteobacteria bacterium]|nr:hypothetical protein [Deltaproteobacteria bacterium]
MGRKKPETDKLRAYKSHIFFIAAATIILMSVLMINSQQYASPVNDEPANIPSGYAFLLTGKYEDPTHPPLARYLFAIPLFFLSADPMGDHDFIEKDWHRYGRDFIFRNGVPADDIIFWTRFVNIALTCLLAVVIFIWSRRFWGNAGAVVSVLFFAFEPTVLGHGSLATTDMAISLIFFLASFSYMRYRENPSLGNFLLFALAACAAPLVKFSGVIVFASVFVTHLFARGIAVEKPGLSILKRAVIIAAVFISLASIAYRFESRSIGEDPQIAATREAIKIKEAISGFAAATGVSEEALVNAKIPLYSFLKGFGSQIFHSMSQDLWEDGDFYQYLMGDYSRNGWRYYFPAAFALKSTLPFIAALAVLLAVGFLACARGFRGCVKNPLFVYAFVPFAVYLLFSLTTTINIGIRYILPLYPFIAVFLGWFGGAGLKPGLRPGLKPLATA